MSRSRLLLGAGLELKCIYRKLSANFSRHLTIFFCFTILFFLFFNISFRFLQQDLEIIPVKYKVQIINSFASFLLITNAFVFGYDLAFKKKSERSIRSFLFSIGESKSLQTSFTFFSCVLRAVVCFIPLWFILLNFLVKWEMRDVLGSVCIQGLIVVIVFFLGSKLKKGYEENIEQSSTQLSFVKDAIAEWRLRFLLKGSKVESFVLYMVLLFVFITGLAFDRFGDEGSAFIALSLLGFTLAALASNRIAEDFDLIRLERLAGVSHDRYMAGLLKMTFFLSCLISLIFFLGLVFSCLVSISFFSLLFIYKGVQGLLVVVTPLFLINSTILQIDPRQTFLQTVVLFLVSFVFCTGIMISPLVACLHPFVSYYGRNSQKNRYYSI